MQKYKEKLKVENYSITLSQNRNVMANIKIIKGEFEKGACAAGKAEVFANAIKHDHRSKNPTTRWSDIIELK